MDFMLKKYEEILQAILDSDYSVYTVKDYLVNGSPDKHYLILRHDVDWRPDRALNMAKMERRYGLRSTYYFRTIPRFFNKEVIKEIHSLGHEVGYHYETLDIAKGNTDKALSLFEDDLEEFNKICEVKTICMHGNPFSKWDNRDLWKHYDFRVFGILGEAYLSVDLKAFASNCSNRTSSRR